MGTKHWSKTFRSRSRIKKSPWQWYPFCSKNSNVATPTTSKNPNFNNSKPIRRRKLFFLVSKPWHINRIVLQLKQHETFKWLGVVATTSNDYKPLIGHDKNWHDELCVVLGTLKPFEIQNKVANNNNLASTSPSLSSSFTSLVAQFPFENQGLVASHWMKPKQLFRQRIIKHKNINNIKNQWTHTTHEH